MLRTNLIFLRNQIPDFPNEILDLPYKLKLFTFIVYIRQNTSKWMLYHPINYTTLVMILQSPGVSEY